MALFLVLAAVTFITAGSVFAVRSTSEVTAVPVKTEPLVPPVKMTNSVTSSITNGTTERASQIKRRSQTTASASESVAQAPQGSIKSHIGASLYVDPLLTQQGRPAAIAAQPRSVWFGGWNSDVQADVANVVSRAAVAGKTPSLVAYNIPGRDCGSYSAGGANSSSSYRAWIDAFAAGIGSRTVIVILEPDALAGIDCLSADGQTRRLADLSYAVSALSRTGASIYIDAGNYSWQPASVMAKRLKDANVANARGFSLNVSGYGWTNQSISYGQQLVRAIGGSKGFVIDTSRNGNGPAPGNEWCNPRGRALGLRPSTTTNVASLDAYLWVKVPGESDGTCGGGPAAGEWWQAIADELIGNAR